MFSTNNRRLIFTVFLLQAVFASLILEVWLLCRPSPAITPVSISAPTHLKRRIGSSPVLKPKARVLPSPKPHGRFLVFLRDRNGHRYQVRLFARNERIEVRQVGGGYSAGDISAYGTYRAALKPLHARISTIQHTALFGFEDILEERGEFNLNRQIKWVYVLPGKGRREPDLLVIMQYETSNTDSARLFFVQAGRLEPILFRETARESSVSSSLSGGEIAHPRPFRFTTEFYSNADGCHHRTWRFEPSLRVFRLLRDRIN